MSSLIDTNILDFIGNTPLLHLKNICPTGNLYAKAEWYNPSGSVKARPAYHIMKQAIASGELTKEKVLLDATSGNTGIAYAMIGATLGYDIHLCMPSNVTPSRKKIIQAYGTHLILTDPLQSSDGAIEEAQKRYREDPTKYFYADQYTNANNWKSHYTTTGPEIIAQTQNTITHFVAGLGTTGTFMGTSRYLKEQNPAIQVIEVQPDSPFHGLEGWKHMETAIVPAFYDDSYADRKMVAKTELAYTLVKEIAHKEGLLVSPSCGGSLQVAMQIAEENPQGIVVTIFPDSGDKYLEERFWEE